MNVYEFQFGNIVCALIFVVHAILLLLLPYKCVWWSLVLYLAEGAVLTSGLSILGFESVGDAVTPSSEPALLLRLAEPPFAVTGIELLHTESSDRDRPMNRDTLPVPFRAASISVPKHRKRAFISVRINSNSISPKCHTFEQKTIDWFSLNTHPNVFSAMCCAIWSQFFPSVRSCRTYRWTNFATMKTVASNTCDFVVALYSLCSSSRQMLIHSNHCYRHNRHPSGMGHQIPTLVAVCSCRPLPATPNWILSINDALSADSFCRLQRVEWRNNFQIFCSSLSRFDWLFITKINRFDGTFGPMNLYTHHLTAKCYAQTHHTRTYTRGRLKCSKFH